jgi:hypothetical protein
MTNLFDALDFCLQEMERGAEIESVLARFPEHADELRPILKTAAKAQKMAVPAPDADVVRRSRARVMQHAAELRESRVAPVHRRNRISLVQRLVISFGLAAIFLLSGSGLLSASASALPGEQLYPVKRGWENIRLFFIFDSEARALLEDEFENERLHEVNELLAEGRDEVIEFAGVFMQVNGVSFISGLQVILPEGMPVPENGQAVIVSGQTNAQGFVTILSLEVLPAGSVVPPGNPLEMEIEEPTPSPEDNPESGNEPTEQAPKQYEISGTLQVISPNTLIINGMTVYLDEYILGQTLCVGMEIEVKGYYAADGRFIVQEVNVKGECSNPENSNSDEQANDNLSNDDNGNDDNSNDDNGNDDDSNDNDDDNSGGGDDDDDDSGGGDDDDDDDNSGGGGDDDD